MSLYFFDINDGTDFPDLNGSEWPDLAAARIEAVGYSAEVLKEMPDRFWNCEQWTMTVSDANREPLLTLKFLAETTARAAAFSIRQIATYFDLGCGLTTTPAALLGIALGRMGIKC